MQRTTLTALLVSTVIGASVIGYGMYSHAEEEKGKTETTSAAESSEDYVVIKYKGGEIRKSELNNIWSSMFPGADAPDYDSFDANVKAEILKNIARERVVLDKAYAANIDKTDAVKDQVENLKRQVVIQAYLKSRMDEIVPEKDVKKEYEVLKEKFVGKEEVKASHILLETEEDAKAILAQVKDGADFAELASAKSLDTSSGSNGGDLGYFSKERMVPEFADAAFKASKGDIVGPVKTDFGWHIIKVEDKRDVKAPAYEEVRERIQQGLANAAIEGYVSNLLAQSDVTYHEADGSELKPAAEAPAE
jgi:peptidyl-prolyl cis-trans isomerase C